MISKSRRFPLRSDRRILREGKHLRGKLMEIFTRPSDLPKLAVIVGKNVSLKASSRNLIRRRLQEVLVKNMDSLNVDVVVRAQRQSGNASYEQLETELRELLSVSRD